MDRIRLLMATAFVSLMSFGLIVFGISPAEAAPGVTTTIKVGDGGTRVRSSLDVTSDTNIVGGLQDGDTVQVYCVATGPTVTGPYGSTNVWNRIGTRRWVNSTFTGVKTGKACFNRQSSRPSEMTNSDSDEARINVGLARVRSAPGTSKGVVKYRYAKGTRVNLSCQTYAEGRWWVKLASGRGYIASELVAGKRGLRDCDDVSETTTQGPRLQLMSLGSAAEPTPTMKLLDDNHTRDIEWLGNWDGGKVRWNGEILRAQAAGGADFRSQVYQLDERNSTYDYYVVRAQVAWSFDGTAKGSSSPSTLIISSSEKGEDWDAVGDLIDTDCKESPIDVKLTYGFVTLTTTPKICDNAVVRNTVLKPDSAWWTTTNVAETPKWDVVFTQKVRADRGRPNFRVGLDIPHYYLHIPEFPGEPGSKNFYGRSTQEHWTSEAHHYTW